MKRIFVLSFVAVLLCCSTVSSAVQPQRRAASPVVRPLSPVPLPPATEPDMANFHAINPGFFTAPVRKPLQISSTFGPRWHDRDQFHLGIDFFDELNTPVYAVADGEIFQVDTADIGKVPGEGNVLVIKHTVPLSMSATTFHDRQITQFFSYYSHLGGFAPAFTKPGTAVKKGSVVGYMGRTGDTESAHLHFETRLVGHCALPDQVASGAKPSETSSCDTGFDPHVHPYVFIGGENNGMKSVDEIQPVDTNHRYALRYCATRGHLDLDSISTDFGSIGFNLRDNMQANTRAQLDDLAHITSWLNLRPLEFFASSSHVCYELHFPMRPQFVSFVDIYGYGIRVNPQYDLFANVGEATTLPPMTTTGAPTNAPSAAAMRSPFFLGTLVLIVLCSFFLQ